MTADDDDDDSQAIATMAAALARKKKAAKRKKQNAASTTAASASVADEESSSSSSVVDNTNNNNDDDDERGTIRRVIQNGQLETTAIISSSADDNNEVGANDNVSNDDDDGGGGGGELSRTAQQPSTTTTEKEKEGGGGIIPLPYKTTENSGLDHHHNHLSPPPMSIAAAQKRTSSPPKASSDKNDDDDSSGRPPNIAALAAAAALQKSSFTPKATEGDSDDAAPPISIAVTAAAAAAQKKKTLSPTKQNSESENDSDGGGPPMSIAAMAAAAARKKASTPKAAESESSSSSSDDGSTMTIPAHWEEMSVLSSPPPKKALESDTYKSESDDDDPPPMNIAAMAAAAAAQKKMLSPPTLKSDEEDAAPLSIAAMAAAAAQKKMLSSPKEATESESDAPMSIAALAAAAAAAQQKTKTLSSPKASDGSGGPPNIAVLAAAAAQKKASTPKASDDSGRRPNIAALAAATALKKVSKPEASDDRGGRPNIAALAAAAAQKKSASHKSADGESGVGSELPFSIAALAAAAAKKKAVSPPKSSESESGGTPWDERDNSPPMSIAALAAAAAQKKASTLKASDNSRGPSLSISAMAAEAARKRTLPPKTPVSLPNVGAKAAAAARNRQQQHHHHPTRAKQHCSLPQRTQQKRKPNNIIIQQHCRRRDRQSLPRAYNSPKDIRALELHKKQSETAKLKAQRNNLQLLERRGQMRQIHSSLNGKGNVDPLERLVLSQNTSASSSHSYMLKSEEASSSSKSDSFDLTRGITNLPKNSIYTQLKDDSIIDVSSDDNVGSGSGWGSSRKSRKRSYYHATHQLQQEQLLPHNNDSTVLKLSSLRSSAMPSRSLDKVRERRKRQIYDDVDDSFNFADESPSEDVHHKAAQALLRVIRIKNLDFDSVLEKLEDLGQRQKERGSSHGGRDKENRREEHRVITTALLRTPENNVVHDDDSSIGDHSTESADHRRLAKNAHKLANHIMQTPQQEFASTKVPLKEDPEYNLYFRMLRYGFTMGAVRAALSRDGKPDITRLDPDRPLRVQKVPRALDRFNSQDSVEVSGLEISHEGVTDEGWEHALSSARESSDLSFISSPAVSVSERTPRSNLSGLIRPGTPTSPPPWLHQSQADRGIVQGWLRKKTRRGRWVRRWYYLDATGMYYSHAPPTSRSTSSKLGKYTKLADTRALRAAKSSSNPLEFKLWHQSNSHAPVTLRAHSLIDLNEWVDAVSSAIERQRLVDEVVVGHVVPVGELHHKVGVLGGGLFGDGSGDSVGVGGSQDDPVDGNKGSGDGLCGGEGYRDGFGGGSGEYGDAAGAGGFGDDTGGQDICMKAAMSSRNLRSVMDGEPLNIGEDGGALISAATLDEVQRLFTVGSGPLIPQISTPQPKRPRLKRQNSWPPISLMSSGDFAMGDGLSDKKIDDDLKKPVKDDKKSDENKELQLDADGSLKSQQAPKKEGDDGEPLLKDDKRYAKYFKMMQMGLPKEAVKHAMKRDGIEDDHILDLDPDQSLQSQQAPKEKDTGPPLKDDKRYAKYFKMLKMGLPKEAAKHAMKRDGIEDDSILDLDPDQSLQSQQAPKEEDTGPPLKDDPKYAKYFKMLKMGLPKEAAKHAMVRDQLNPMILDMDPDQSMQSQQAPKEEDTGPPLKEDPKFAKYFKMMKMVSPHDVVLLFFCRIFISGSCSSRVSMLRRSAYLHFHFRVCRWEQSRTPSSVMVWTLELWIWTMTNLSTASSMQRRRAY